MPSTALSAYAYLTGDDGCSSTASRTTPPSASVISQPKAEGISTALLAYEYLTGNDGRSSNASRTPPRSSVANITKPKGNSAALPAYESLTSNNGHNSQASRTPPRASVVSLPKPTTSNAPPEIQQVSMTTALQTHQKAVTAWDNKMTEYCRANCRGPTLKDVLAKKLPYYLQIEACKSATLKAHARLAEEYAERRQATATASTSDDDPPPSYEEAMYITAVEKSYEEEVRVAQEWDWLRLTNWRQTFENFGLLPGKAIAQDWPGQRREAEEEEEEED